MEELEELEEEKEVEMEDERHQWVAQRMCALRCQLTVHCIEGGGGPAPLFFSCNRHLPNLQLIHQPSHNPTLSNYK